MRSQDEPRGDQTGTGLGPGATAGMSRVPAPAACARRGITRPGLPGNLGWGGDAGLAQLGTEWQPAQRRRGWRAGGPGRGPETATGWKERVRDRTKERKDGGGMLTRNTGAEIWGWGVGSRPKGGDRKFRSKGQTGSPESPSASPLLSLAPNPLYPHPKQDAVSMTTWLAKKGGWGLQRKFSTLAGREEGRKQGRKGLGTMGATKGPGTPSHCAHCPRILTPTPTPTPGKCTLSAGPLWGRGKVLERIKGQMSKDQPLPRP